MGPWDDIDSACVPGGQPLVSTTLEAAVRIARNPEVNVSELFALQPPSGPFQPVLASAPTDWLLAVTYAGIGGLNGPAGVAIDADGNVWIANQTGNSVTKLDPAGGAISPAGGFTGGGQVSFPYGIAINSSGYAWIANGFDVFQPVPPSQTLTILLPSGVAAGFSPVNMAGSVHSALPALAINHSDQVWVTNQDNGTVTAVNSDGSIAGVFDIGGGGDWLAIGNTDDVWIVVESQLVGLHSPGNPLPGSPFSGGGIDFSSGVAVDASGNVWVTNFTANTISKVDPTGTAFAGSPFSGGGVAEPQGIAIDGVGNAWIVDNFGSRVTELDASAAALSPNTGFTDPNLNGSLYDAIDSSGNVWVTNSGGASVTEFIGPAAPVKTPLIGPAISP